MKLKMKLFFALIAVLCVSCNNNHLVKSWKLDNMDFTEIYKEVPESELEMMKKDIEENVSKTKGKIIFVFDKENKLEMTTPNFDGTNNIVKGTWKLSEDKKVLTTEFKEESDAGPTKQDFTVHELSGDKLVIEPKGEKIKLIFVPKK